MANGKAIRTHDVSETPCLPRLRRLPPPVLPRNLLPVDHTLTRARAQLRET